MIFLLGSTGYVGQAFRKELDRLNLEYRTLSRSELDYSNFRVLRQALEGHRPELVINAAGYTGKPNVDACEARQSDTILGNVVLTQTVAQACEVSGTRLGYVSSGCIFSGAKIASKGKAPRVETNLTAPEIQGMLISRSEEIQGFNEEDHPNFTFEAGSCSFYSGTKALAEKVLEPFPDTYVWRLRIPFDEQDSNRNYLSKIQRYPKIYQNWNSLSHLTDFVSTCIRTWQLGLDGGIYNVVNPGYTSTREVVALIQKELRSNWNPEFWLDDEEFYKVASAPRSNCLLDTAKLLRCGIKIRPLEEALTDTLRHWRREGV